VTADQAAARAAEVTAVLIGRCRTVLTERWRYTANYEVANTCPSSWEAMNPATAAGPSPHARYEGTQHALRPGQRTFAAVVKLVMTMLWMWGLSRPCRLVWCSKEATAQCWGLTGANRVRPVFWKNSSTA
jgi:hypothetical protein